MAKADMVLGLSSELSEFINKVQGTQVRNCLAKDCKNNYYNRDTNFGIGCSLQHVYIMDGGQCEEFDKKDA